MAENCPDMNWLPSLLPFVQVAITDVLEVIEADEDHHGGYFTAIDSYISMNVPTLTAAVGYFPRERAERRFQLSIEKPTRLLRYPTHVSSHQSKCQEKEQFGGAIRTTNGMIFSFSGLPRGIDDEAVCLLAAERTGQIDVVMIEAIISASDNIVYRQVSKTR